MTVLYEAYQSSLPNKEGQKLFYPRVVRVNNVSTSVLAEEIAGYSSLSSGDVKNALDNLVVVMTRHLQSSESVTIDGFGSFRIIMKSKGKGAAAAKEVKASQSTLQIRFLPASTLNNDRTKATRSLLTGTRCKRYDRATGTTSGEEENPDVENPGGNEGGGIEGI